MDIVRSHLLSIVACFAGALCLFHVACTTNQNKDTENNGDPCVCTESMTTTATARGHRAKEMRQQNTQLIKLKRTH